MLPTLFVATLASSNAAHVQPVMHFPGQGDLLTWCQGMSIGTGLLLILLGLVYLLYGWSQYKWLVTVNAALIGMYVGAAIGARYNYMLAGGALGGILAASATLPLVKWAVAVVGGVCGALVGAAIWQLAGLQPDMAWAGAMTGLVGFGMLSFILLRGSVIMYTSLQGAMMLIIGLLGLMFKHQDTIPKITQAMNTQPFVLPIAVFVPAILGLIYQQTHSSGGAGAGGGGGAGSGGGGAAAPKK